jgi:hypothetical protein
MQCLRAGDLGRAESLLHQVLAQRPNDLEVIYGLAEIGFHTGRPDLVIAMMRRCARRRGPNGHRATGDPGPKEIQKDQRPAVD